MVLRAEVCRYGLLMVSNKDISLYKSILDWCANSLDRSWWEPNINDAGMVSSISIYSIEAKTLFELTWK